MYKDFKSPLDKIESLEKLGEDTAQQLDDISINVKKLGAKGDGTTDDTQAVLNAAALLPNGGTLYFPKGTFIVNNVEIPSKVLIRGAGRDSTQIKRNADNPVFKVTGTALAGGGAPSHWYNGFEDLTIGSVGSFPSDLTVFQGVTSMSFQRMKFYATNCRLVFANQMWDSRFENVQFFEGGKADGTPALELAGGLNGYKQTKETVLHDCHFEGYKGAAIRTQRDNATQFKTDIITFTNLKFESKNCTGSHLNLEANNLFFDGVYVSTEFTTTDVIKMVSCRGVIGKIRVGYAGTTVVPASLLNTDANCFLFDLVLTVSEPQPVNSNVWTYAADIPGVRLNAQYPVINSRTFAFSQIPIGSNTVWFDSTGRMRTNSSRPTSDTSGYRIAREEIGNTSQRPTSNLYQGRPYFDTTLGKPIWYDGSVWRDATGATV